MKLILIIILTFITLTKSFGQSSSWDEWEKESSINKNLLPKYGNKKKSDAEKESDEKFIKQVMAQEKFDNDKRAASNYLIQLGFNYIYRRDLKKAMYRFNQGYLLDSTNTDIYWGYGAIYMTLGNYELGKEQYIQGLSMDSTNTHLLTDLSTYYFEQYFALITMLKNETVKNPKEQAKENLDSAIYYLQKSYQIDPIDENTLFKLSTVYYYTEDCENAWKYYNECKKLGGRPITESYTKDLEKKCKKNK